MAMTWERTGWILLLLATGCGGGGSSGAGGQACTTYGAAFCKRIYACTPAAMQDADFHESYGSSEAQCAQQEAQLCNTALPGDETALGTNCAGGKHVNMAALTLCMNQLDSAVCADFIDDPYANNNCADVCVSGMTGSGSGGATGSGGSSGTGGATGSGGSSGGANATAFCKGVDDRLCDLTFQCTSAAVRQDAAFIATFGTSASDCKTLQEADCSTQTVGCMFNSSAAATCVAAFNAADCNTDLDALTTSTSCAHACMP
jgi:hypothetical protein